jgi:hypothetical protein
MKWPFTSRRTRDVQFKDNGLETILQRNRRFMIRLACERSVLEDVPNAKLVRDLKELERLRKIVAAWCEETLGQIKEQHK